MPNLVFIAITHLYLNGRWFSMDPRIKLHQNDLGFKEIGLSALNLLTIIGSIINMIGGDPT